MRILKKILFSAFAIFLCVQSLLRSAPENYSILESFVVSFLLCLFVTGIFAFPGFVFQTHRILGAKFYTLKNPKNLKRIYKLLGVKYFRNILMLLFWGIRKNRKKFFSGTRKGLYNFIYQTKQAEFGHLGSFFVIFILSLILVSKGHVLLFIFILLINILGNLYPVILQRFHRVRIGKITEF